jgi:hypothetical protein
MTGCFFSLLREPSGRPLGAGLKVGEERGRVEVVVGVERVEVVASLAGEGSDSF